MRSEGLRRREVSRTEGLSPSVLIMYDVGTLGQARTRATTYRIAQPRTEEPYNIQNSTSRHRITFRIICRKKKDECMFIHGRPSGSNGTTDIYNQTTCKRMLHKIVSLLENSQHSQHSRPWRFVDQCLPASQITCRLGVPSAPVSGQHEQAYSPRVPAYAERTTFQCADKAVNRSNSLARSVVSLGSGCRPQNTTHRH